MKTSINNESKDNERTSSHKDEAVISNNEMIRLKDNIAMCLESLDFTKKLIENYIGIF